MNTISLQKGVKVAVDHAGIVRELRTIQVVKLIVTVGVGIAESPCGVAEEWWTLDGKLLRREVNGQEPTFNVAD